MKNKLPKTIALTILAVALVGLGWYQEIFYYRFTFEALGMDEKSAKIAGMSLSILLCYSAYKKIIPLFISLLLFSIVCTIFGQLQLYSTKEKAYSISTVQDKELKENKERILYEIQRLNSDIDYNNSLLPDNATDRAIFKTNGVDPIKADIKILKSEKKDYEAQLEIVSNKLSTGTKVKGIFEKVSDDIGFKSTTLLKYIFWVFYSLFVALLAPSGTTLLSTVYTQGERVEKKGDRKKEKANVEADNIEQFANSRFRGEDNPPSLKGRSEVVKELGITHPTYQKMVSLEKKLNLVRTTGNMTIPNVSRSQYVMLMRNKKNYSGNLTAVL